MTPIEKVLGADVLVTELLRRIFGGLQHLAEVGPDGRLRRILQAGSALHLSGRFGQDPARINADLEEGLGHNAVGLLQQRHQQRLALQLGETAFLGHPLGGDDGLLGFLGKSLV